jgi:hypothetical protein
VIAFLTTRSDSELQTQCYDCATGRMLWTHGVKPGDSKLHRSDVAPAATPATDGQHVVSYFGSFGLICHDAQGRTMAYPLGC